MFYLRAVCQRVRPVIFGMMKETLWKKMADIFQHGLVCNLVLIEIKIHLLDFDI